MGRRTRETIADLKAQAARLADQRDDAQSRAATAEHNVRYLAQQAAAAADQHDELLRALRRAATENRQIRAERDALKTALDRTLRQLEDAVYTPGDNTRLNHGTDWQTRRSDKPTPSGEVTAP